MITTVQIRGEFYGIYEWGRGYVFAEMKEKWDYFWNVKLSERWPGFWKYVKGNEYGEAGSLVSVNEAIYLHPMTFNAVLATNNGNAIRMLPEDGYKNEYHSSFASEIYELNELCKECAEYCGGRFELFTTKEQQIETLADFVSYDNEIKYLMNMVKKVPKR